MAVRNRGTSKYPHWHVDFRVRGTRYRVAVPEARTKQEAQQAESRIRSEVFEGRFGLNHKTAPTLREFVEQTYLPYARANKKSSHLDVSYCKDFVSHFGEHRLDEITPLSIERYKQHLIANPTYRHGARTASSVNKHIHMLSPLFSYALDSGMLVENPARKVRKLRETQNRTRVLSHEEEERLLSALDRPQRAPSTDSPSRFANRHAAWGTIAYAMGYSCGLRARRGLCDRY